MAGGTKDGDMAVVVASDKRLYQLKTGLFKNSQYALINFNLAEYCDGTILRKPHKTNSRQT